MTSRIAAGNAMLKDWRALGAANASDAREGRFWAADWQWLSTVADDAAAPDSGVALNAARHTAPPPGTMHIKG